MADYLSTYGLTTWFDIGQTTAASWQLVMLEWKKAFCAASDRYFQQHCTATRSSVPVKAFSGD